MEIRSAIDYIKGPPRCHRCEGTGSIKIRGYGNKWHICGECWDQRILKHRMGSLVTALETCRKEIESGKIKINEMTDFYKQLTKIYGREGPGNKKLSDPLKPLIFDWDEEEA